MNSNRLPAGLLACAMLGAAVPAGAAQTSTYTLTKVLFQGNQQVPTSELQAALPIQPGQSIDQSGVQDEMTAIQGVYQKHNVGAKISARLATLHSKATITYIFDEQAPVAPVVTHVGITADTVTVAGNNKIKSADILAAANIPPGGAVTNEKLQAAQAAIVALYKKANIGCTVNSDWTNAATAQHINLVFKIVEKT